MYEIEEWQLHGMRAKKGVRCKKRCCYSLHHLPLYHNMPLSGVLLCRPSISTHQTSYDGSFLDQIASISTTQNPGLWQASTTSTTMRQGDSRSLWSPSVEFIARKNWFVAGSDDFQVPTAGVRSTTKSRCVWSSSWLYAYKLPRLLYWLKVLICLGLG